MKQVISKFSGMAPRFAPGLPKGASQVALDVNLSDGKMGPASGHLAVGTGSGDSLNYYDGTFVSGVGKFFCPWMMDGTEILFSLENGVAKKTVGDVTADLGQVLPGAPTVVSLSSVFDLCDDDTYSLVRTTSTNPEYVVCRYDDDLSMYVRVPFLDADVVSVFVDDVEYAAGTAGSLSPGEFGMEETVGPSVYGYLFLRFVSDPSPVVSCGLTPSDYFTSIAVGKVSGNIDDTVTYAITTLRSVGGIEDESGLGAVSESITANHETLRVTRPVIDDEYVTHWLLYRLGSAGGEFQFCAKIAVATTTYDDDLLVSELGASPVTYYTSDQQNEILFSKPDPFDGLCGPHAGMLFGWKDSTLYWSEPGKPDGWPAYYSMNFPSVIKSVVPFSSSLIVLCESGPFRVDGTHPELLQQGEAMGAEPCLSSSGTKTSKGVVYMSDSGVVLFNGYETQGLTDALFGEAYFSDWAKAGVFFAENDGRIFVFHEDGALVFDVPTGQWTELSLVATAAFRRASDGELYVISAGQVLKVFGGAVVSFRFLSGDYYGKDGDDTEFAGVHVTGSGAVTLGVYVDGVKRAERALDFTMDRGRVVKLRQEHAGRALWFELTGTGRVTEVTVL